MGQRGRRIQFTVEELRSKVEEYFNYCDDREEPYTIVGLCRRLKIARQTLLNYENEARTFINMSDEEIEEFVDIVKDAKMRVEEYNEKQLHNGKNPAGSIFVLKNFGWKDTQEVISTNTNYNANSNVLKGMSKEELLQMVEKLQLNSGKEEDQQ